MDDAHWRPGMGWWKRGASEIDVQSQIKVPQKRLIDLIIVGGIVQRHRVIIGGKTIYDMR